MIDRDALFEELKDCIDIYKDAHSTRHPKFILNSDHLLGMEFVLSALQRIDFLTASDRVGVQEGLIEFKDGKKS